MKVLVLAAMLLVFPHDVLAQSIATRPDFSGNWKLKEEIADFRAPLPNIVQRIVHRGDSFEITVFEDDSVSIPQERYVIGAPAVPRPSACCGAGTSRYWWQGTALHGSFDWSSGGQVDARTLTADGKFMMVARTISQGGTERVISWVFERQP